MKNLRIYDNGGNSIDRYTAVFMDRDYNSDLYGSRLKECLAFNGSPFHGFGQHGAAQVGRHLGKRIKFDELNKECQRFITDNL